MTIKQVLGGIVGIVLLVNIAHAILEDNRPASESREDKAAPIDHSAAKQEKRRTLIQKLINEGYLQKVEYGDHYATVYVTPQFMALNFDDKQKFASVIFAYAFSDQALNNSVELYSSIDHKRYGRFGALWGGLSIS
jgi:hypothetical protein